MWLGCISANVDTKCMHVDSNITEIFKKTYRAESTVEFDLSTHTHAIFKITYNELRLTTILFQLPIYILYDNIPSSVNICVSACTLMYLIIRLTCRKRSD